MIRGDPNDQEEDEDVKEVDVLADGWPYPSWVVGPRNREALRRLAFLAEGR